MRHVAYCLLGLICFDASKFSKCIMQTLAKSGGDESGIDTWLAYISSW